jgi:outer membrane protein assembly factor BamD
VVEAAHVGEPMLEDAKRTLAPEVTKENIQLFNEAAGKPAEAPTATPTGANEPPRSDAPSTVQLAPPTGAGTGVGVSIVSAPNGDSAAAPAVGEAAPAAAGGTGASPLVKAVGPTDTTLPAVEKPTESPMPVNDIRPGTAQQQTPAQANGDEKKKSKANLDEESSSKKKKKKGLGKLNPF